MAVIIIGIVLGSVGGATWGTAGAFTGAVIGFAVGMTVHSAAWLWAHSGNLPVVERHRLMCTPSGTFADCELEGDAERGRWLDVKRCSLQGAGRPGCDKGCLALMNHGRVRPGRRCSCR
jgi:hypothetical protein